MSLGDLMGALLKRAAASFFRHIATAEHAERVDSLRSGRRLLTGARKREAGETAEHNEEHEVLLLVEA